MIALKEAVVFVLLFYQVFLVDYFVNGRTTTKGRYYPFRYCTA